jgi:hypothetical protein
MGAPFTVARLKWRGGVSLGGICRLMVEFFSGKGLRFGKYRFFAGEAVFKIRRLGRDFEFMDTPWQDNIPLRELLRADWEIVEPDGSRWGSFCYYWENQPGATTPENLPTRIFVISLTFDGLLHSPTLSSQQFEKAYCKYRLLRELFTALDCDELLAVDANAATALIDDNNDTVYHRDKDLRFAKEGTQVLIRQFEELGGRLPENHPALAVRPGFIYLDPEPPNAKDRS